MSQSIGYQGATGAISRGAKVLKKRAGDFGGEEKGTVAMIFGLATVGLMIMVGGAVDFGRWLDARSQTRAAVDAAVLAGARTLQVNSLDTAVALKTARAYYRANVASEESAPESERTGSRLICAMARMGVLI